MTTGRIEAFSDGVIAIILTIMVLELRPPAGSGAAAELLALAPAFLSYILSFLYVGIYWNNHHHLLHTVRRPTAAILWANLHLLFWLSMVPFATAWMGAFPTDAAPTAAYGVVMLFAAIAYTVLQGFILHGHADDSPLARAIGSDWKGKISLLCYLGSIGLAYLRPAISQALFLGVAALWLVPDRRVEQAVCEEQANIP